LIIESVRFWRSLGAAKKGARKSPIANGFLEEAIQSWERTRKAQGDYKELWRLCKTFSRAVEITMIVHFFYSIMDDPPPWVCESPIPAKP